MYEDFLKISLKSIQNKGIRSWLTVIGIVIGISAIVSLISLGQGLQDAINQQFAILGPNLIIIMPGGGFGPGGGATTLSDHDIQVVENVPGVDVAGGFIAKVAPVKFKDKVAYLQVSGIDPANQDILLQGTGIKIEKGQPEFKSSDSGVVAIGYQLWGTDNVFSQPMRIGDKLTINGRKFTVVSFISKIGNKQDDSAMYITQKDEKDLFDVKDNYIEIMVRVKDGFDVAAVADKIKEKMRRDRNEKKGAEDYIVITLNQVMTAVSTILTAVQAIVIGIALISLVVGGVNIMNNMYTSVLERTREIGVMKAIGARNEDITTMFIIESGIIGLVGGVLGVIVGGALSKTVEYIALTQLESTLIQASLSPALIIGALLFSFVVGVVSGYLPARQAAHLNPVEALRYE
jgi:putative ABC transport system permease protein